MVRWKMIKKCDKLILQVDPWKIDRSLHLFHPIFFVFSGHLQLQRLVGARRTAATPCVVAGKGAAGGREASGAGAYQWQSNGDTMGFYMMV